MKFLLFLAFTVFCAAGHVEGFLDTMIVGGSASQLGQFPFLGGMLFYYLNIEGTGKCGGSLVTNKHLITAAHCWNNGTLQAYIVTVILGSIRLYDGGIRQNTSDVFVHPNWTYITHLNDVAIVSLSDPVELSDTISTIALPSGYQINESFAAEWAFTAGFGLTNSSGFIRRNQNLSHVEVEVITNEVCVVDFPRTVTSSNICTSSRGGRGTCRGDSGGPLVVIRNNTTVLIGVTSYGVKRCESDRAAVYARVTSFLDFFHQHI